MLEGKKTYITGVIAIVTAVGAYLTGEATLMETLTLAFGALTGMFIRNGLSSETKNI